MKIKEIIVVEGKHDASHLQQFFDCDTIITNGSDINDETIELIRKAQETRGVIILTDPDFPGNKIREIINSRVPGCINAFVPKEDAIGKRNVGIEYTPFVVIKESLSKAHHTTTQGQISWEDYVKSGIMMGSASKKRKHVSDHFNLGHANNKQLYKRLNMFNIGYNDFMTVLNRFEGE